MRYNPRHTRQNGAVVTPRACYVQRPMRHALWLALNKPRQVWRPLVLLGRAYAWFIVVMASIIAVLITLTVMAAALGL